MKILGAVALLGLLGMAFEDPVEISAIVGVVGAVVVLWKLAISWLGRTHAEDQVRIQHLEASNKEKLDIILTFGPKLDRLSDRLEEIEHACRACAERGADAHA